VKILRAPASSANLGPGFDTLGMALGIYLECRYEPSAALKIEVTGRDASLIPANETNLIWQTIARYNPAPLHLEIHNDIPLGKGLGSSAAALTAGIAVGNPEWSREQVMNECSRIEGHPDNAAACALGGIVASATNRDGSTEAVTLALPAGISIAVIVPDFALATSKARAALPECYNRADTVFNLQRTALLVAALATGSRHALSTALEDTLHQPYRAPLVPGLTETLSLRTPGLLGCTLSGAGPSVLVFFETGHEACVQQAARTFAGNTEILFPAVDTTGFQRA
jgi:homoserine kinase